MGGALNQEQNAPAAENVRALWRAGRIQEARLELVRATERSVYRFLRAMVRDDDTAQDLTQDAFVRAFQSLGSFRGEAQLTTWMLSIARNLALNRMRRWKLENRWQVVTDQLPEVADVHAAAASSGPRLMAALAELSLQQRETVALFYLEDLSIDQVSRLTGRPAGTIKSDLHRARAALRAALEERSEGSTRESEDTGEKR